MAGRRAPRILGPMRARPLVPLALLAVAVLPAAARPAVVGISDQDPASFSDARLRAASAVTRSLARPAP
jgi:hypothetical protein